MGIINTYLSLQFFPKQQLTELYSIMKKLTLLLLTLTLLINFSCSDSDSSEDSLYDNFVALFNGNMLTDFINNEIDGIISISDNGDFKLESSEGTLTGDAVLDNNVYSISNLNGNGIFEDATFTSGQLDLDNSDLSIIGNYIDSSNITINGPIIICPTNSIEDCGNNGNQSGLNIFENTISIDYSNSSTSDTQQVDFTEHADSVSNSDNGARIDFGGPTDCNNTKSDIAFFHYSAEDPPLTTGTFNVGVVNSNYMQVLMTVRDCSNRNYRALDTSYGTITINRIDPYIPDTSGEIHVTFNNVRLGDLSGNYIVFSGTLKGRWNY